MKTLCQKLETISTSRKVMMLFVFLFFFFLMLFTSVLKAANYYWVGGTGNWNDFANHWATTSGGTTFHTANPGVNDDVFFDDNSFSFSGTDTVFIFSPTVPTCRDFSFINSLPIGRGGFASSPIGGHGITFQIRGNLGISGPIANYSVFNTDVLLFSFWSNQAVQYIQTSGNRMNIDLYSSNTATYNLLDDLDGSFLVRNGRLNTNGHILNITSFLSRVEYQGIIDFGNSIINSFADPFNSFEVCCGGRIIADSATFNLPVTSFIHNYNTTASATVKEITAKNIYVINDTIGVCNITGIAKSVSSIISNLNLNGSSAVFFNDTSNLSGTNNHIGKLVMNADTSSIDGLTAGLTTLIDTLNVNTSCKNVILKNGYNTNIIAELEINTTPGLTTIKSDIAGIPTILTKSIGTLCFDYLSLKDVIATGGAQFFAGANSVDLGGNTGWQFVSCAAANAYYWVGGTGNWSDVSHWATTSGGSTFHSLPPSPTDDVYFDANSFSGPLQTIVFNNPQANCHNFNWSNNNLLSWNIPSSTNLNIYGSFYMTDSILWNITDSLDINFLGSFNQTIYSPFFPYNNPFLVNFKIMGTGTYELMSDLVLNGKIVISNGVFNAGNKIYCTEGALEYNGVLNSTQTNTYSPPGFDLLSEIQVINGAVFNADSAIFYSAVFFISNTAVFNSHKEKLLVSSLLANNKVFLTDVYVTRLIQGDNNTFSAIDFIPTGSSYFTGKNNFVEKFTFHGNFSFGTPVPAAINFGDSSDFNNPNTVSRYFIKQDGGAFFDSHSEVFFKGFTSIDTLIVEHTNIIYLQPFDTSIAINALFFAQPYSPSLPQGCTPAGISSSSPAFLKFNTDTICTDNFSFQNIAITGANMLYAGYNGVDNGGNFGINFSPCGVQSDVWPGDANYDLTVNNADILNIGLTYGNTGPVRAGASLAYVAQPATDWNGYFQTAVNHKHADTNGDGVVNNDDTTAVSLNYGLTHPARMGSTASNSSVLGIPLYVDVQPDSAALSDTVDIDVMLGTAAMPVDSIYGLAFTLNFDTAYVDTAYITSDYSLSWMGTTGVDLLCFDKKFATDGKIDVAITRTDQNNINGFGSVARFTVVIVDNVSGRMSVPFTLSNVYAITADEYELLLNVDNDSLSLDTTTGISSLTDRSGIYIYPNPAKDILKIKGTGHNIFSAEITDAFGRKLIATNNSSTREFVLPIQDLNKGLYILNVTTDRGVIKKKIIKQ